MNTAKNEQKDVISLEDQLFLTRETLTIYEYPVFSGGRVPLPQGGVPSHHSQSATAYKQWQKRLDDGDEETLKKRLCMQNLETRDVNELFCPPEITTPAEWVGELEKILELMPVTPGEMISKLKYTFLANETEFYTYLAPVMFYIEQKLKPVFHTGIFEETACRDILENLFEWVKLVFRRFSISELNKKAGMLLPQPIENLSEYYVEFTEYMLNNGLKESVHTYPVLWRSLIETCSLRIDFVKELAENLIKDHPYDGTVTGLNLSVGDTHNHGRSVAIVEFVQNKKLVYKPQNGRLYTAFGNLLEFLESRKVICHMEYARALASFPDHSYIEYIEHRPIQKDKGAERFYYRIGQLACLFYVLGTEDMHHENIIAHGEYPIPVDLETLLTGKLRNFKVSFDNETYDDNEKTRLGNTVMQSILLTIGGSYGGAAMRQSNQSHVPFYADGKAVDFQKVCQNILEGFQTVYENICRDKEILIDRLSLFKNCQFRTIIRSTQTYYDMLRHSYYINYLHDGLARSFEVERFFSAYKDCDDTESLKKLFPVFEEECKAVLRGDFPLFFVNAGESDLMSENNVLYHDFYEYSPIAHAEQLLRQMCPKDFAVQEKFINLVHRSIETKDFNAFSAKKEDVRLLDNAELIGEAERLFDIIQERQIFSGGRCYYLAVHTVAEGNQKGRNNLGAVRDDFYSGTLGIALFFGALYATTKNERYRSAAVQVMDDVYNSFSFKSAKTPLGMSDGVGGMALVFFYLADYLDRQEYKNMAREIIENPVDLETVEKLDYLGGLAGYIAAACKVNAHRDIIERAADKLVSLQISYQNFNVWNSDISKKPLIGMGHGLSGIALAFVRAYQSVGKDKYLQCAADALTYEKHFYDEKYGWPDLRDDHSGFMTGFCSGAPGVGLARLSMMGISKEIDKLVNDDIERALFHTSRYEMGLKDDVCCGNSSGIDLLITAAAHYDNEALLAEAKRRLSWMAARSRSIGIYGNDSRSNLEAIGFFNGVSGIGYEMLRAASGCIKGVFDF